MQARRELVTLKESLQNNLRSKECSLCLFHVTTSTSQSLQCIIRQDGAFFSRFPLSFISIIFFLGVGFNVKNWKHRHVSKRERIELELSTYFLY